MRNNILPLRLLITCLVLPAITCLAAPKRGVWMWSSSTLPDSSVSPYGTADIVGDGAFENETVSFLKRHCVQRVYGSYQNRPLTEPAVIAAWNAKLQAGGIDSQILLSGAADVEPASRPGFLTKVQTRLIDFNNAMLSTAQRFDALHLDLEPQQLAAWNTGTPATKRAYLGWLLDTYTETRALMNAGGLTGTGIHADIPFTWDKLPVDGGSIGWADAADRDAWFAAAAAQLSGISVMTFSKDNFPDLTVATAYERAGVFLNKARVAIQPLLGPGEMWPDLSAFNSMAVQLETAFGSMDIENYAYWRHAISSAIPVITLAKNPCGNWLISLPARPSVQYRLMSSPDLQEWKETATAQTLPNLKQQVLEFLAPDVAGRQFWKVEEMEAVRAN